MSNFAQKRPFASLVDDEEPESTQQTVTTTSSSMTPAEKRFCLQVIKSLFKNKRSIGFQKPVDIVAFNIPDYFDIVKHPMDLGTAEQKLNNDQYPTIDDFIKDIQLIFDNCYLYNNPSDPICQDAKKLEIYFKKLLKKAPTHAGAESTTYHNVPPTTTTTGYHDNDTDNMEQHNSNHPLTVKLPVLPTPPPITPVEPTATVELMPDDQMKRCKMVVKEMKSHRHKDYSWPFLLPVDPTAWGAQDYYQIIKHPMDMSTYERKLNEFEYANEDQLADDIRLMLNNCYTYNPPGHDIYNRGKMFEEAFEKYWEKIHQDKPTKDIEKKSSTSKRRRSSYKDPAQSNIITIPQNNVNTTNSIPNTTIAATDNFGQSQLGVDHSTENVTVNHKADEPTTNGGAPRSNILRLKLSVKPKEEDATPKITLKQKPSAKVPGLALSKEPPPAASAALANNPKLAIGERPPSPPVKKVEPPTVLQNQDKWLALASKKKQPQQQPQHQLEQPAGVKKQPLQHPPAYAQKEATIPRVSPPPQPVQTQAPKPAAPMGFDITQITSQILQGKRAREQEERAKQEKFEREEKIRLDKERVATEEKLKRIREFNIHAKALKEKDKAQRAAELNKHKTDISKQKMMFYDFERKLRKDNDYLLLYQWQRETVNYRNIPVPAFVKRSSAKLQDIRAQLLSKCIRLENSNKTNTNSNEDEMDYQDDSDMDVE